MTLHELAEQTGSLEEAFIQLTGGAVEYGTSHARPDAAAPGYGPPGAARPPGRRCRPAGRPRWDRPGRRRDAQLPGRRPARRTAARHAGRLSGRAVIAMGLDRRRTHQAVLHPLALLVPRRDRRAALGFSLLFALVEKGRTADPFLVTRGVSLA